MKPLEVETDLVVLARRQKQIDFGKSTMAYKRYIAKVDRRSRVYPMPQTPDKNRVLSRRHWDGAVKLWKLQIHDWDKKENPELVEIENSAEAAVKEDLDKIRKTRSLAQARAAAKSIPSWAEELDDVSNEARQIVAEKRQAPLSFASASFSGPVSADSSTTNGSDAKRARHSPVKAFGKSPGRKKQSSSWMEKSPSAPPTDIHSASNWSAYPWTGGSSSLTPSGFTWSPPGHRSLGVFGSPKTVSRHQSDQGLRGDGDSPPDAGMEVDVPTVSATGAPLIPPLLASPPRRMATPPEQLTPPSSAKGHFWSRT